jgi:hypothetical protein
VLAIALLSTVTLGQASTSDSLSSLGQYENGELAIDFALLPGVRINLWISSDIAISTEEPSHVQHGFVSTLHWSAMTPFEQTEFLSTNTFRLFYKGDEVPLRHVTRYDPVDDYMWSIFYRVFPPGFFPKGMHQVRGEWTWQENSVWETHEHTGKLDVYYPIPPTVIEDPTMSMTVAAGIRLRNFNNLAGEPGIYIGTALGDPAQYDEEYIYWVPPQPLRLTYTPDTGMLKVITDSTHVTYDVGSASNWDVMQIEILEENVMGDVWLRNANLDGYPLGEFSGFPTPGGVHPIPSVWALTDYPFNQGFTFTAILETTGIWTDDADGYRVDILIGTLDTPP